MTPHGGTGLLQLSWSWGQTDLGGGSCPLLQTIEVLLGHRFQTSEGTHFTDVKTEAWGS